MTVVKSMALMRAGIDTCTAFDAKFIVVKYFRFETDAFRVVAPPASQRTSFQKNRGPDARTIMNREMLNIGNKTADCFRHCRCT
jgi:hypothetical protein